MAEMKGDHDRVVIASRKPDGTPDQSPDFEFIGPKTFAVEASKEQMRQQAVSAVDTEIRGVESGGTAAASTKEDPTIAKLQQAHDTAASAAEKRAEAEVNEGHHGLGDTTAAAVAPAGSTDKTSMHEAAKK